MKSVLQAAWLMTVALGNLVVVVVTLINPFKKQSLEFFFFAALMVLDMMVFAVIAYFYVPYKPISNEGSVKTEPKPEGEQQKQKPEETAHKDQ